MRKRLKKKLEALKSQGDSCSTLRAVLGNENYGRFEYVPHKLNPWTVRPNEKEAR